MRFTRRQILEIVSEAHHGKTPSQIAREREVDPSTIRYHVAKFEAMYGSTAAVYSLIPPKPRACTHPSLKCLVCGRAQDNIHCERAEKIHLLQQRLARANRILEREGWETEPIEV